VTSQRNQNLILTVFVISLVIQVAAIFAVRSLMWQNEFETVVLKIVSVYSVPISTACGGVLAFFKPKFVSKARGLSHICLVLVIIWNCIFVARTLSFCVAKEDSPKDLIAFYEAVSAQSSFLIAGVLTFYFGRTAIGGNGSSLARPEE